MQLKLGTAIALDVRVVDRRGAPVSPIQNAIGRFCITPSGGGPALVQRNTVDDPGYLTFIATATKWLLSAVVELGRYEWEMRVDLPDGHKCTIKMGDLEVVPSASF